MMIILVAQTEETIKQKFGGLAAKPEAMKQLMEAGEYPTTSMRNVYRHFPPVVHRWSIGKDVLKSGLAQPPLPPSLQMPIVLSDQDKAAEGRLPRPRTFSHGTTYSIASFYFSVLKLKTSFMLNAQSCCRAFLFISLPRDPSNPSLTSLLFAETLCERWPYLLCRSDLTFFNDKTPSSPSSISIRYTFIDNDLSQCVEL